MAFAAGQHLTAQLLNSTWPAAKNDVQNTSGTTTSTLPVETLTGGTVCGLTFVAPLSGRVEVCSTAQMANSGASATVMGYVIRSGGTIGSGAVFQAAADVSSAITFNTNLKRYTLTETVEGLTAGATYNIRQTYRVNANTGTVSNKRLSVKPLP